ncbi:TPA: QVPTGV class sortase B protein-sorting domain-containing protein [Streptococcus pyogenes]|uniref:QVPTGV class sortase B protein-sorting domain-containing protein n=1 Tax=Streptococcus pyogenes TaxID=1314 RepID=UPI000DA3B575|nr:QVPTGV class sortase B protein-sorting domain-containing protein [Streptococcus pyogenes]TYK78617.1 QVPTGV class sortase B protein-sorting domain-containing protein [Streptococcus pyogenes]SQH08130.1 surface-anchored protein [Streptococcus pyogenes]VGV94614.1 surface-anchored protein [Streptococcus pyogenes]VHB07626.1 surface-anchored protein [Streptococcus pyogenes]VHC29840.1 surface-anchored protein [Streptococcus pyogenes]
MKKNKLLLATAILATTLGTASLNQNVKAETAGVSENAKLIVKKTFDSYTDNEVLMPKADYTFKVEADSTASGKTKDGLEIKPGIVNGLTEQIISYTNTDKPDSKVKSTEFDFSKVVFPGIGVYRYTVSEKQGDVEGITYDTKKWTVDVYVGNKANNEEGFEVLYIVSKEGTSSTKKPIEFTNSIKTTSLKIEKQITGNAGDRKKSFNFTLTLQPSEYYKTGSVVKIEQDGSKKDVTIGTPYKFTLGHGKSVMLSKLPIGINYYLSEDEANKDGYTTTATLKEQGKEKSSDFTLSTQNQKTDEYADEIVVTNKRDTQVPTGVVGTLAPFAVLSIVAIGGVIYITKRKKA